MKYTNPVISGFYPDPSICRSGDDYYLINSSFEYFPGVPIFKSRDLVNWEQIGHCLEHSWQLKLPTGAPNRSGIYAPTIRCHNGRFYMVVTNVGGNGNFYVFTDDPAGTWSKPVELGSPGIDPSLFFDDDGSCWYTGNGAPAIYVQRLDLEKGALVGERYPVWGGSGGAYPEGPHIYKKNGWYYLLISEGGTERCHMITMARSRSITGPYEPCPNNPVMSNRSLPLSLQSIGHADLVEDGKGNWWAVCLGTRCFDYPPMHNLGRETMLVPVDWTGDWPVFGFNGAVLEEFETDRPPVCFAARQKEDYVWTDDFKGEKLKPEWNYIYNPDQSLFDRDEQGLILRGNALGLDDALPIAWIGRRQQHHSCEVTVKLSFPCENEGEEAGVCAYLNNRHHYEAALKYEGGKLKIVFRRRIGSLFKRENEIEIKTGAVWFKITADTENYIFFARTDSDWFEVGRGETRYLTTEVGGAFTGTYFGLYAAGNGKPSMTEAHFSDFTYASVK